MPYNQHVPTPFYHLVLAETVLAHPELPTNVAHILQAEQAAFLLGNIAPDACSVAGIARQRTHFFRVPMIRRRPAHLRLLAKHPDLARAQQLPPAQAAFLAGYLAHVWLDQAWIAGIFEPVFGLAVHRGTFEQRLLEHNLLRAYLDRQDQERLVEGLGSRLAMAEPKGWLPFLDDGILHRWRDRLVAQLMPGGRMLTTEVFAARHQMPESEFAARLAEPDRMQQDVLSHLPARRLKAIRRLGRIGTLNMAGAYLQENIQSATWMNWAFRRRNPAPRNLGAEHENH